MSGRTDGAVGVAAPVVSVVIPTWNRVELLSQAVDSVLGQTYEELELVVVDDGSTDGTATYLDGIPDPRLRRVRLEHTGNVARARNAGAAVSTGTYLCFLDSDDLWLPDKLAVQVTATARAGRCWSYTRYEHIDERGARVPARAGQWRPLSGAIAADILAERASVTVVTVLMERKVFEELGGFDERPLIREDHELLVRLAREVDALAIPDSLALVREHAGRTTRGQRGPEPFLVAARTYETLLESLVEVELRRAARHQRARYLADAAAAHLEDGSFRAAAAALAAAARSGASLRRLASALRRGLGLKRELLRRVLRPALGRESRGWLLLRSPRLRLRCFGDRVDCVLYGLLLSRPRVRFVQVGSNDGVTNDPLWTFRRYRKWGGILVEPVEYVFQRLSRNYAPWSDRFILEQAAVAGRAGVRTFHHLRQSRRAAAGYDQVGSLDPGLLRENSRAFGPATEETSSQVYCFTFRELCEKHDLSAPDLVHVDAEGLDAEIVRQVGLEGDGPAVLLYEHVHLPVSEREALRRRLRDAGYESVEVGGDTLAASGRALESLPPLRSAWRLATTPTGVRE